MWRYRGGVRPWVGGGMMPCVKCFAWAWFTHDWRVEFLDPCMTHNVQWYRGIRSTWAERHFYLWQGRMQSDTWFRLLCVIITGFVIYLALGMAQSRLFLAISCLLFTKSKLSLVRSRECDVFNIFLQKRSTCGMRWILEKNYCLLELEELELESKRARYFTHTH